jgi:hypothetical protein
MNMVNDECASRAFRKGLINPFLKVLEGCPEETFLEEGLPSPKPLSLPRTLNRGE